MITIHLIAQSHLDPIWLWPWQAGVDEILNTCESVCNLLDRNPDVIYTRGEAWVYEQVEKIDPSLFARIRRHVEGGQWEIVGGWYIQPDCNLLSEAGFRKQIELGRSYFERTFGQFPKIGYNVDSFGHTSALPDLMAAAGQTNYIMMRPSRGEMELPARLFRWRGQEGGAEIVTFRIADSYNTPKLPTLDHINASLTDLPEGIHHTMCFVGVGDHGGGPSEEMVEWCRENREAIPGARLEFSSPSRYFRAIAGETLKLPLVTGELQLHAVGCYSVQRSVKRSVRRAENLLTQAEDALRRNSSLAERSAHDLEMGWRWTCFHQFHDTLGGTCIPSAYDQVDAQLGLAHAVADEILQHALRIEARPLPSSPHQRIIVGNYSGLDFNDWIEYEPWLEWTRWQPDWCLIDENGIELPGQQMAHEALCGEMSRLLFKLDIKAGKNRVLRIAKRSEDAPVTPPTPEFILRANENGGLDFEDEALQWNLPVLQLIDDPTDTWSHGIRSFDGAVLEEAKWGEPRHVDVGPLMHSWCVDGKIGGSSLYAEWRRYAGAAFVELRLRVGWSEKFRLLRLQWQPGGLIASREDGVTVGGLQRDSDGVERPVLHRTLLHLTDGRKAGVVLPDTYSLSGTEQELRLTLLRSAIMAHHVPHKPEKERSIVSDQGPQNFVFRFYPAGSATAETLDRDAIALQRRPILADDTRGMPKRSMAT